MASTLPIAEKRERIHTFFDYYLPTTQKLLDAYVDFEATGVEGANLRQAKARIKQTMDAIVKISPFPVNVGILAQIALINKLLQLLGGLSRLTVDPLGNEGKRKAGEGKKAEEAKAAWKGPAEYGAYPPGVGRYYDAEFSGGGGAGLG